MATGPEAASRDADGELKPQRHQLQCWDQRVQAMAVDPVAAQRDVRGEAGARCRQLRRWDQRLRRGRAVAAGPSPAERDAGGEGAARLGYNAGISACAKGNQWQWALSLFSDMWKTKLESDVVSYGAGIKACEAGQQWQLAIFLLSEMLEAKLEPDVISYGAGISACDKGQQWRWALSLLSGMWEAKLELDVTKLRRQHQRLRERPAVAVGPAAARRDAAGEAGARRFIYNAGVSACMKCKRWQRTLELLSEMWEAKFEPNVINCKAGIDACDRSGHAMQVLPLLSECGRVCNICFSAELTLVR
ncbi:unnamed protein product [Prorocentrum cordatum]|uniref:Pentatricopeptide repeat-containing protein n=1 Tax=Prorocentrum cordatum TaxID=2364126 RepID=A0ABN9TT37_9DINO|nr:unnamed protein product [Polarella glacialis]